MSSEEERDLEEPCSSLRLDSLFHLTSLIWDHAIRKDYNSSMFQEKIVPFLLP